MATDLTEEGFTIGQEQSSYMGGAFDNNLINIYLAGCWWAHEGGSYLTAGWTGQDFGAGNEKAINIYNVYCYVVSTRDAKNWTFEGSATGAWAGEETVLHTVTNAVRVAATWQEYTFANSTAYRYYRLNVSENYGDSQYLGIQEIEMCIFDGVVTSPEATINTLIPIPELLHITVSISPPITAVSVNIPAPIISFFTLKNSIIRYFLTLTGAADGTTDIELSMSSFQAKRKSGEPTYLSVVIPTLDYAAEITARANGTIKVEQGYTLDGEIMQRELILEAEIDNIKTYQGGKNQSVILDGSKTTSYNPKAVILTTATYKALSGGKMRYRVAEPNIFLNPGDTVTIGLDTFVIGNMSYVVSADYQQIELAEA